MLKMFSGWLDGGLGTINILLMGVFWKSPCLWAKLPEKLSMESFSTMTMFLVVLFIKKGENCKFCWEIIRHLFSGLCRVSFDFLFHTLIICKGISFYLLVALKRQLVYIWAVRIFSYFTRALLQDALTLVEFMLRNGVIFNLRISSLTSMYGTNMEAVGSCKDLFLF